MKRLAAIVLAIGMVFGSVALRNSLDNSTQAQTGTGGDSSFRLTCAVELADVCNALAATQPNLIVKTEEAGATADRLTLLPEGKGPGLMLGSLLGLGPRLCKTTEGSPEMLS